MTTREIEDCLVYPQDRGTTINHPHPGDPHSAAMKATYGEVLRGLDFAASGFNINVTNGNIDISPGKAIITADTASVSRRADVEFNGEELLDAAFLAHTISNETGISLETTSGTNHVYIAIDMAEKNTGEYHVVTEETDTLGDISLKIAEVDGGSESVELTNRNDAVEEHQENGVHSEPQPPADHTHDDDLADHIENDVHDQPQPPADHDHDISDITGVDFTGDVANPMEEDLDADGHTIQNLASPDADGDAVTKQYVDAIAHATEIVFNDEEPQTDSYLRVEWDE